MNYLKVEDFKVGDKVIITRRPSSWSSSCNTNNPLDQVKLPFEGKITEMKYNTSYDFTAAEIGNYGWCMDTLINENCIKKIEKQNTEFKVGDIVKFINNLGYSAKIGATATIRSLENIESKGWIDIVWDRNTLSNNQGNGSYPKERFENLSKSKENMKFKIGDRVELIEHSGGFPRRSIGTIKIARKSTNDYGVKFDIDGGGHKCDGTCEMGHGRWIEEYEIKLVNETSEEPKELKPGDKVIVIAEASFREGDILTVLQKVPNQIYYMYRRDSDRHQDWTNTCNVRLIINKEQETNNNKQSIMTNVMNKIKELLRKEPEATFVKAGFMDENENLTEGGKEALQFVVWEANKDALKALADKIVAAEDKSKK